MTPSFSRRYYTRRRWNSHCLDSEHPYAGAVLLVQGQVYKEKVWRLPQAAPQARGKALINILPLEHGERINT